MRHLLRNPHLHRKCLSKKYGNIMHTISIWIYIIVFSFYRRYGFESYLINLVNGPRAVLGCLCSLYNLQNIPYGSDYVNNCTDKIPHDIRSYFGGKYFHIIHTFICFMLYFAGNNHCTLTISKYGKKQASLMQRAISSKGLLCSRNDSEINAIKSRYVYSLLIKLYSNIIYSEIFRLIEDIE